MAFLCNTIKCIIRLIYRTITFSNYLPYFHYSLFYLFHFLIMISYCRSTRHIYASYFTNISDVESENFIKRLGTNERFTRWTCSVKCLSLWTDYDAHVISRHALTFLRSPGIFTCIIPLLFLKIRNDYLS